MQFLIIGGTGRSGQLVIEEALNRGKHTHLSINTSNSDLNSPGHQVIALVRKSGSLKERKGLSTIIGSPLIESDILRALASAPNSVDVVIVTLNARRVSDSPFAAVDPVDTPPRLISDSVHNTLSSMRGASPQVPKIVLMSAVGTGESWDSLNFLMRFTFTHTNMRFSREDHDAADQELKTVREEVKFVEVRPWMLTDGPAADVKVYPDCGKGAGFMPKISRASVAKFLVDAAETSKYDGKAPVITN
jgi:nucleoside-diphosphate-sugar epimerase